MLTEEDIKHTHETLKTQARAIMSRFGFTPDTHYGLYLDTLEELIEADRRGYCRGINVMLRVGKAKREGPGDVMSATTDALRAARELLADIALSEVTDMASAQRLAEHVLTTFPDPDAVGKFVGAAKALRYVFYPDHKVKLPQVQCELFDAALAKLEEKP